jgi:hypothetical protein
MQVPPIPPAVVPGALQPDAVAKTLPQIQAQASVPVTQRAIDPSRQGDRGKKSRGNGDKSKGGGGGNGGGNRGGSVNIKV